MSIPARTSQPATAQKAAQVINFKDVRCEYVDVVARNDRTFHLRDDIPMDVMVSAFSIKSVGERLQALDGATEDEITDTFDEARAELFPVLGDIVRHSYPETTDEELAAIFSLEEAMQLIQVFFQRRSAQWQALPGATSGDTVAVVAQATAPTNRLQRRATATRRASTPKPPR